MSLHYVYYLHDSTTGKLLYVGRSNAPHQRIRAFTKRTGIQVRFGRRRFFDVLEDAQAAELHAIKTLCPPFNKALTSSKGNLGMSPLRGRKLSEGHKRKIREGGGRPPLSMEARERIRQKLLGHHVSEETRRKIGEKNKGKGARLHKKNRRSHEFGGFAGGAVITKTASGSAVTTY